MKIRSFSLKELRGLNASLKNGLQCTIVVLLVTLSMLGSLSSCQRAPYAPVARSVYPAYQRPMANHLAMKEAPRLEASASLDNLPTFPVKTNWEETPPVAEGLVATEIHRPSLWHAYKRAPSRKPAPPPCDQIVLRNGDVVEAKVKEVGVNEIRYKKCDRQDGPDYTISKRDVLSVKYSNGEVERFNTVGTPPSNGSSAGTRQSYDSPTNPQNDGPRTDPFAIVALAAGGLAVLTGFGAFLLGAAAIVFGALSLSRIRKEPGRFKGKGLALAGMVAGIVGAGIILLYLLL